ncbi:MAG TPA: hypothetical protein VMX35_07670 [Acidobacteriota bacterium]|nr:hypothetical protein [Acidobacteriota bacterium]
MRLQVTVRVGQWLLVAIAALLLAGGLMAIFALDASSSRAVAGEREPVQSGPAALGSR